MRGFIFVGSLLFYATTSAQPINQAQARTMYFEGWQGQCGATLLAEKLSNQNIYGNPTLTAYKGAAISTLANCSQNPFKKLKVFYEGRDLIEEALKQDPGNTEIRFLRFTIQSNIPAILNYDDMDADKEVILEHLTLYSKQGIDADLRQRIISYFLISGNLSDQERQRVEQLMAGN